MPRLDFTENTTPEQNITSPHDVSPKINAASSPEAFESMGPDGIIERFTRNDEGNLVTEYLKDGNLMKRRELLPSGDISTTLFDDKGAEYLRTRITYSADGVAELAEAEFLPDIAAEIHGYTLRTDAQGKVIETPENTEANLRALEREEGTGILDSVASYIIEWVNGVIPPDSLVIHMAENAAKLGMARFGDTPVNKAIEAVMKGKAETFESSAASPDQQEKPDAAAVLGQVVKYAGIGAKVGEKIGKAVAGPEGILPGKVVGAAIGGVVGYVAAVEGVDFAQDADSETVKDFIDRVGSIADKTMETIKAVVPDAYETAKSAFNEFLGRFSHTVNA